MGIMLVSGERGFAWTTIGKSSLALAQVEKDAMSAGEACTQDDVASLRGWYRQDEV
jgi:hypothetical protein